MTTPTNPQTGKTNKLRKTSFLADHTGKLSSIRLMSFVSLLAAIAFGWVTLTHQDNQSTGIYITFGFLAASFGGKTFQKFVELNPSNSSSDSDN